MKKLFIYLLIPLFFACQSEPQSQGKGTQPPSHKLWDELLKKHVDGKGMVDYEGFIQDKEKLQQYLDQLSNTPPDPESWSEAEQLAYWINAYNAFTVKLIVDFYPVESIEDLHPTEGIPTINTVWHKKFFKIGGEESSLDEIEHQILRKQFQEPRIHFAINCASFSCPPLRQESFTSKDLNSQLEEQAVRFINDPKHNKFNPDGAQLSKIFSWFEGDFTKNGNLIDYLNRYAKPKLNQNTPINFLEYDWKLNKQETKVGEGF